MDKSKIFFVKNLNSLVYHTTPPGGDYYTIMVSITVINGNYSLGIVIEDQNGNFPTFNNWTLRELRFYSDWYRYYPAVLTVQKPSGEIVSDIRVSEQFSKPIRSNADGLMIQRTISESIAYLQCISKPSMSDEENTLLQDFLHNTPGLNNETNIITTYVSFIKVRHLLSDERQKIIESQICEACRNILDSKNK